MQVQDVLGYTLKMRDNEIVKIQKYDEKAQKYKVKPFVQWKAHYKIIDSMVKAQESKAYSSGYDIYADNKNGSFEFMNTKNGISLVFVQHKKR